MVHSTLNSNVREKASTLRSPFVHKYRTERGFYVYDVNTNDILKADEAEYDLVDDYGPLRRADLIARWRGKYTEAEIERALDGLDLMVDKGYLSAHRPSRFVDFKEFLGVLLESGMEQLILNTTETCNLRCRYCLYSGTYPLERTHSAADMSLATAKLAIKYFKEHSGDKERSHLSFYGGEPLTCFETVKGAVEYAESLGGWGDLFIHVDSNSTLITDEIIDFLVKHRIALQVSLDGPKEVHDRFRVYRNGKGTYDRIMRNVNRIKEADRDYYRDYVYFVATLTPPYDLTRIDEFFAQEEFAANTVSANFMEIYDTEFFEKYAAGMESMVDETLMRLKRNYVEARAHGRDPSKLAVALLDQAFIRLHRRKPEKLNDTIPLNGCCMPGVRRVFVTADGDLYPCDKVESKEFAIGHVDTGVDRGLVEKVVDTYAEHSIGDCADCWASRLCSMCYNSAKHGAKFDIERKRERCEKQRTTWHATLQMYTTILENNPKAFDFVKDLYIE